MKVNNNQRPWSWILGILLITIGLTVSSANGASYPEASIMSPSPMPVFPGSFGAFSPPVTNNVVGTGAPELAEWTRSNDPGDTMALAGSRLSSFTDNAAGRDTRFVVFGQSGSVQIVADALIQRLDGGQAAITLSDRLPSDSMYMIWPRNSNGYGRPALVNQTEVWWIGPDAVQKGTTFSLYGRNLGVHGSCHLYIEGYGWLESISANGYRADFLIPETFSGGRYTVWAHNGMGREYGWAKPLTIDVLDKVVWNGSTYDVTDFGAKGDGTTDDFGAISAAINAAESDQFSTVYFPAGTYAIAGRLPMKWKDKIRYMGAGMNQTIITPHPNHASSASPNYIIYNTSNYSEFRDLTFQANQYGGDKLFFIRDQKFVHCENVRFSQLNSPSKNVWEQAVDIHNTTHISFKNCEFIMTGRLFYGGSNQVVVDGCSFYGLNDNNTLSSSWGGSEIAIKNCTAQSYDNSDPRDGFGWCKGRFFHSNGTWGSTRSIYFGGNTTVDMTPRYDPDLDWYEAGQVDQNSGEAFMCEVENTKWRAHPVAATANSITLAGIGEDYVGHVVAIVSGSGFGQTREIVSVNASIGVASLDESWNVIPDQNSVASIGTYTHRMIVHDNYFDGTERAISDTVNNRNIANGGVQPYGGASSWIVAGNTFHQMRQGLAIWARYKDNVENLDNYCAMPQYFNTYVNNSFESCRDAINVHVDKRTQGSSSIISDISLFGDVFRGNVISDTVNRAIGVDTEFPEAVVSMTIFDQNTIHSLGVHVAGDDGQDNHVWTGNIFEGNGSGSGVVIASGHIPVFHNNTWNNFSSKYSGALPGSVLELPIRAVSLGSGNESKEIVIRNSGTEALNWTASTPSPWLTLKQSSGTIYDENSEGIFLIEADMEAVPEGDTEGVITIESNGGQIQQITVEIAADASLPPPPPPPPAPVLTDIVISGASSMDEGTTAQYLCTASYSDGTTATVAATWSENSTYASINASGVLTAGTISVDQNATITASFGGLTDTYAVTINYVPPVLTGIVISGSISLDEESSAQYSCTATYSDGSSVAVMPSWSENSSFATISSSGLLSTGNVSADQSVTLTASYGGKTDTHSVTINYVPPTLVGIAISGSTSLDEGTTAQYICTATYSDGSSVAVTPSWSENSAYASINTSGVLRANDVISDQSVVITANFGGTSDTHSVTIKYVAPTVTNIVISGLALMDEETSAQYVCTASYSDGTSKSVVPSWSENSSYTTISGSGLLVAADVPSDQNVTITATYGGQSDTHVVAVNYVAPAVELTRITILGPDTMEENTTSQYVCTAHYSDGTSAEVSPAWSATSFASIDASGLLSAANVAADENATVTASFDGQVDTQALVITVVGDQVVFPLDGFTGKTVSAELWDDASQATISLGEEFEPEEIVIENVNSNQWYWLGFREYNVADDEWLLVHGRWIWM